MLMSEPTLKCQSDKRDFLLRLLVLGTLYGLALSFAIAFSPSLGVVQLHPTGEVGRIAAAPDKAKH
jgi:hypothetical protein